MSDYLKDKQWSDRFLPQIKRILGEYLITSAPLEEDQERNTDLIVLKLEAVRIGCRVRKFKFLAKYGWQFTIRSERTSGTKTELAKIIEGWGRYLFYAFANEREDDLAQWKLIDLNAFRLWFNSQIVWNKGQVPGDKMSNADGGSSFVAFDTRSMCPSIVFASWCPDSDNNEPF